MQTSRDSQISLLNESHISNLSQLQTPKTTFRNSVVGLSKLSKLSLDKVSVHECKPENHHENKIIMTNK